MSSSATLLQTSGSTAAPQSRSTRASQIAQLLLACAGCSPLGQIELRPTAVHRLLRRWRSLRAGSLDELAALLQLARPGIRLQGRVIHGTNVARDKLVFGNENGAPVRGGLLVPPREVVLDLILTMPLDVSGAEIGDLRRAVEQMVHDWRPWHIDFVRTRFAFASGPFAITTRGGGNGACPSKLTQVSIPRKWAPNFLPVGILSLEGKEPLSFGPGQLVVANRDWNAKVANTEPVRVSWNVRRLDSADYAFTALEPTAELWCIQTGAAGQPRCILDGAPARSVTEYHRRGELFGWSFDEPFAAGQRVVLRCDESEARLWPNPVLCRLVPSHAGTEVAAEQIEHEFVNPVAGLLTCTIGQPTPMIRHPVASKPMWSRSAEVVGGLPSLISGIVGVTTSIHHRLAGTQWRREVVVDATVRRMDEGSKSRLSSAVTRLLIRQLPETLLHRVRINEVPQ